MPNTEVSKKRRGRYEKKTDEHLKVCPVCNGVWSNISIFGEKNYKYYPRGIPTIGKKRELCRLHRGENWTCPKQNITKRNIQIQNGFEGEI